MKKSLIWLSSVLLLALIGCKERERQYTYYDDEKQKNKEVFEVDVETGKKDGKYKSFYENGQLKKEISYKNGELDGSYEEYYRDGKLKIKTSYKNGEKEGSYEEYYENGNIAIEHNFKNGAYKGKQKNYDSEGELIIEWVSSFPESKKGSMKDPRDGKTYKTVKIGKQVWMAENLNFKSGDSWCYNNSEQNCNEYGRLYSWEAALNACPEGWHLPTKWQFEILRFNVGGEDVAGKMLKSTTGWYDDGNGVDKYGFNVLPAGIRYYDGVFCDAGKYANFWSATENDGDDAYYLSLDCSSEDAGLLNYDKDYASSVRCLRGSN